MTDSLNDVNTNDDIFTPSVAAQLKQYGVYLDFPEDVEKHEASDLEIVSTLEKQAFCEVLLVKSQSKNRQLVMKRLDNEKIQSSSNFLAGATDLATEARFLTKLDHENIVKLQGVCGCFLTMEVMRETLDDRLQKWHGDLSCYVDEGEPCQNPTTKNKKLDEQSLLDRLDTTALKIADAMEYIHDRGIVLRALTPSNVGYNQTTGKVCLLDFSFARYLPSCRLNKEYRSPHYTAPEVRRGEGYSLKSDVYSFGMILYEIASLNREWRSKSSANQEEFLSRPSLEDIPCEGLQFLVEDCLSENPESRPSFAFICTTLTILISATRKEESLKEPEGPLFKPSAYVSEMGSHHTFTTVDCLDDEDVSEKENFEFFDELEVVEC